MTATLTPADLATIVALVDRLLPGWEHTTPATRLVNHEWRHATEAETVTLAHYLTSADSARRDTQRWLAQLSYYRGRTERSHQVLDSVAQVPAWLALCGAAHGTLRLIGADR